MACSKGKSSKTLYTKTLKSFPACDMDSNDEYRPYHTKGSSRNGPYQPNTCSRKANGTNLPFFASSMQEGKKFIYPVKVSTPIWSHNEYWNREKKKNETEIPVFFFLVPWENAESSFEDSVVKKKIMNNISYTLWSCTQNGNKWLLS